MNLRLLKYYMCASKKWPVGAVYVRELVCGFAVCVCDRYIVI